MQTAVDYTKEIAEVVDPYLAFVASYEGGVYQIEFNENGNTGGRIIDELRQVLPENTRFKLYPDGVIEVEIGEENGN